MPGIDIAGPGDYDSALDHPWHRLYSNHGADRAGEVVDLDDGLVATGHVCFGGGSGQWTLVVTVALDRIPGAANGLSASDIESWNVNGKGMFFVSSDSDPHGDDPACGI